MTSAENFNLGTSTAESLDGREFHFSGSADMAFDVGALVLLTPNVGKPQLGQIEEVERAIGGAPRGAGRILGVVDEAAHKLETHSAEPFFSASVHAADSPTIELLYDEWGATLEIGTFYASPTIPARLLPHRFNRHTFWCGQSGSGKTYALGVVLEQLLLHTRLPMVVFDPNGDFVTMAEPADGDSDQGRSQSALARRDIRVLRPSAPEPDSLRVRFSDLSVPSKAAVLRLDPLTDRAEHNELLHLEEFVSALDARQVVPQLREHGTPAALDLASRIENLRVTEWDVWAGGREAVTDIIETRPDATVLDLGGFNFADESLVVALAVLDDLWAKREQRRPLLIVIDEAHNLCSPDAMTPMHVAVRERIIQIAAEGRKFGLWLVLSTQRPSRIDARVISQCDNLALMKMTSPVDLAELGTIFGFVPAAMLARAARFSQGEALFAGGFVPAPTMVRMATRLTLEGGTDVRVPIRIDESDRGETV
ncbi:ATP-binding protein [Salinibacterium hongtaonis]|uniref:ATP-binding protein n=1 Tax=Homoserinimonas hongtaonis TaxID=2079791 RepID=A0A2U1T3L9_9MICO|nr:ATP-binding protein [Salinibacterium hongtaonis]PWB98440.1 ATP-binding protein [Salinibacterium hongtaonis]